MNILAESNQYLLGHVFEQVFVVDRQTGKNVAAGDHFGDPQAGLIDPHEQWFLTVGEGVQLFSFAAGVRHLLDSGFPDADGTDQAAPVTAIRLEPNGKVLILLDPWSEYASTWQLDPESLQLEKLCDGPDLRGEPYRDEVEF